MATEVEPNLKLEIAHVLTIDVVAYSTLLIHKQSQVMARLNKIVRDAPCFRTAEAAGKLTRLPTGDGMALVFFGDPEAPIECAMQIAAELRALPEIPVRMGIHSGAINQILDVNDRSNVAGAGIDMAQRVMDCGDAGHILLSKRVADDLAPYPRWNHYLHDLGECEVKHGRKISVFNFYTETLGNPAMPCKVRSARTQTTTRRRRLGFLLITAAILATGAVATFLILKGREPIERSIAVLPFLDLSQDKNQGYLGDGIPEQIINSLGKIRGLFVVARSSAFVFRNKDIDIREIGRLLHVRHVMEGSVSHVPGHVRVDAHLIDVTNGYQRWAETYDSSEEDALTLQSDIAQKVARALQVQLQLQESKTLAKIPTHNPQANDLYLRGRYLLNKKTAESIQKARALMEEAVAMDNRFALGHAGIADADILLAKVGAITGEEAIALAWPHVSAALEIDDQLPEAYTSRAILLTDFDWNWPAAETDFKKALALDPNSAAAHHWYARHLAEIGREAEGLAEIQAAQKLDPLSPALLVSKAKILFVAHRYEEALEPCRKAIELEPDFAFAYSLIAQAQSHRGEHSQALEAAKKFVELSHGSGWSQLELAYAYADAGDLAASEQIINEVTTHNLPFSPYDMATIYAARKDVPAALHWLETSITQRPVDAIWLRVDPRLDNVRNDPGFKKVIAAMVPRP